MKISILRKIYPYLPKNQKNIKWRNLTDAELDRSMSDKQMIANCYDEATRYALLASEKGRTTLKKRFKIEKNAQFDPAYKLKLNVNGKEEIYKATKQDYFGREFSTYKEYSPNPIGLSSFNYEDSRLSLGVNIAINKLISKHPSLKPIISRLYMFPIIRNKNCEYNKPSNAFKWFTGKTPISYGEDIKSLTLKKYETDVLNLLKELGNKNPKEYSFVAVTGSLKVSKLDKWHTMPIIGINPTNKTIQLLEKRTNTKYDITFKEFIEKFKAICGIKWD